MKILHFLAYLALSSLSVSASLAQNSVDFTSDKTSGCGAIANIQFTDLSTGQIVSWHWDFGNNNTSTLKNPIASYTTPGTYTVSLTVSGPNGSLTESKTAYIKVFSKPKADFLLSANKGCEPFEVTFSDTSILADAPIGQYIWDFGDGSPENNQQDPVYTYNIPGNYMVSLQVIDTNGCTDTKLYSSVEVVQRPMASFSSYNLPTNCSVPYSVSFANYSTGASGLSYHWDFGDGNTSNLKEPVHSYTSMGKYDVQLVVKNNLCSDTILMEEYVTLEPISASFDLNKKKYCYGDTIEFKALSAGANSYLWDFGDGSSSTDQNPIKIYSDSGHFVVQFTASSGAACSATDKDSLQIIRVESKFTSLEDTFCMLPVAVKFTNSSINADEFEWWIKDSLMETQNSLQDFEYIFTEFGEPWVKLHSINNTLGCSHKDSIKLVFYNAAPSIINLSDSTKGCFPVSVSFDFNYNFNHIDSLKNFEWFVDDDGDSSTANPFNYTISDPGNHKISIRVENERGCIVYDQTSVNVGDTIIPPQLFLPDTICAGNNEYFLVNDTLGIYPQSILHKLPSGMSVRRDLVYAPKKNFFYFQDTGKVYIQRIFDYNGCISKSELDSVYVKGPIVDFSMSSKCNNMLSFDFAATIKGSFSTFKWEFGDGSSETSNLSPTHLYANDSIFEVSFIAYNSDSSCIDTLKKLLQPEAPPQLSIIGGPHFCVGENAVFQALTQNPSDTINWYIQNSLILADTNILKLNRSTSDTIHLKVTAKNELGCMDSVFMQVVFSEPKANFDFFYTNACVPFTVQLISNSTAGHYPMDSLFWKTEPWGYDTNIVNLIKTVDKAGVLSAELMVQDKNGCRDTLKKDSLLVVKGNKLVLWSADRNICVGDTIWFGNYSTINEPNYRWTFGDGDTSMGFNALHIYNQPGKFDVSLQYLNDSLCDKVLKFNDYISVEAHPIADFTADTLFSTCYPLPVTFQDLSNDPNIISWMWDFGDGVKSAFQNPFHNYLQPGKFDVSLKVETKNGCSGTLEKTEFIQTSGPTADITISPDTGCIYDLFDFQISQLDNIEDFQWNFGDGNYGQNLSESHKYSSTGIKNTEIILSDSTGTCTVVLKKDILVLESTAELEVSSLEACVDENISFNNTSVDIKELLWDFGDGTQSNISNSNHSYSTPGNYQVKLEIMGTNNCKDDTVFNITVHPRPTIEISADTMICLGDTAQLYASGGENYLWKPSISLSDQNIPNPLAFPDTFTTYTVEVTNIFGCMDSADVNVNMHYPPEHTIFRDTNLIIGESLWLSAVNNPGFTYSWSPETGLGCNTCQTILVQPLESTTYFLGTNDPFGCFSIVDSINIKIKEAYSLKVPSAFTPNGDGNNDIIFVRGWGIKELLEFKVYNRWGELVFESNDINKGWDGKYKDKDQNMETYVYTVKALMWNDEIWSDKGNLNLMR